MKLVLGIYALLGFWAGPVAADSALAPTSVVVGPVVVELFTSQSCSSCPPAEALLGKLAGRPDLIALEFHVDYWNDLVHGAAGRWTDVHSSPVHSARQRAYGRRLGGGVYTPQMVIDGRAQAIGSRADDIERAIAAARQRSRTPLMVTATDAGGLAIRGAAGATAPAELWLVRYLSEETTRVRAGENRGQILVNHHIVTGMIHLADWPLATDTLSVDPLDLPPGEGCAVLLQASGQGPIMGAATCPKAPRYQ